jgi:NTE family protein
MPNNTSQTTPFLSSVSLETLPTIRNLVFQGGSVQGVAYLGALKELLSDPKYQFSMENIQRIGGASAGAISGFLIGVGYSVEEVEQLFTDIDFLQFLDGERKDDFLIIKNKLPKVSPAFSFQLFFQQLMHNPMRYRKVLYKLQTDTGLFSGECFREWVEKKLFEKTGIKHITFAELAQLKQENSNIKDLYFIGTNIATSRSEIFSHEHTPDMIISDAVRISVSLPFLFMSHHFYEKKAGKRVLTKEGHFYIDGGVIDNYPIWLFDSAKYLSSSAQLYRRGMPLTINPETLGFRLIFAERNLPKVHESPDTIKASAFPAKKGFLTFVLALMACYVEKQESDHWHRSDFIRTIYIDATYSSMFDFDLTADARKMLVAAGQRGVQDYFTQLETQETQTPLFSVVAQPTLEKQAWFATLNKRFKSLCKYFLKS